MPKQVGAFSPSPDAWDSPSSRQAADSVLTEVETPLARVLLVDDQPELLAALERTLRGRFEVASAGCAAEGLRKLESEGPFAVVVSDYEMPDLKGTEFLAQVHRRWPETIGIMLTGVVSIDA